MWGKIFICLIGHVANNKFAKSVSYIVDGKTVKTIELDAECMPKSVSVPLNYGLQMKIISSGNGNQTEVGIGNIIVK